jgi:hypothetical protein
MPTLRSKSERRSLGNILLSTQEMLTFEFTEVTDNEPANTMSVYVREYGSKRPKPITIYTG